MANHVIQSQKIVLQIQEQQKAFDYQDKVSRMFNNGLQRAVEIALDEIAIPGEVIRINRLDIDLGEINSRNFEKEFEVKLVENLRKAVRSERNKATNANLSVIQPSTSQREAFIYFLLHGTLPWYCTEKNIVHWEDTLFEQWTDDDWRHITGWIKEHAPAHSNIIPRIAGQFSSNLSAQISKNITKNTGAQSGDIARLTVADWLAICMDVIFVAGKFSPFAGIGIKTKIWTHILSALIEGEQGKDTPGAIVYDYFLKALRLNKTNVTIGTVQTEEVINNLKTAIVKDAVSAFIASANIQTSLVQSALSPDRPYPYTSAAGLMDELSSTAGYTSEIENGESPNQGKNIHKNNGFKKQATKTKQREAGREDISFVNNCGIVLLHPFLGTYFADLGLLEQKQFIHDEAKRRAVMLLYYLATGETEAAEFSLLLQKVLCGYTTDETLDTFIELSENEIEESGKLLRTVIDYWPPLKNTSVAGFRNTFLQREGKLSQIESGWLLRVDQKTVDILIGKLPWGFSTVRLPWMDSLMNIEWA